MYNHRHYKMCHHQRKMLLMHSNSFMNWKKKERKVCEKKSSRLMDKAKVNAKEKRNKINISESPRLSEEQGNHPSEDDRSSTATAT